MRIALSAFFLESVFLVFRLLSLLSLTTSTDLCFAVSPLFCPGRRRDGHRRQRHGQLGRGGRPPLGERGHARHPGTAGSAWVGSGACALSCALSCVLSCVLSCFVMLCRYPSGKYSCFRLLTPRQGRISDFDTHIPVGEYTLVLNLTAQSPRSGRPSTRSS